MLRLLSLSPREEGDLATANASATFPLEPLPPPLSARSQGWSADAPASERP